VYLRGVNYHQDSFENGWAMTDSQRERDYAMITEVGANAVRMAHYQHCRHEYEICDREGLIVWSEIPFINRSVCGDKTSPAPKLAENLKQQLTEMIRQNYNHPSVFFWGISNELYDVDKITCKIYNELVSLAKSEDKSRTVIYADNVASSETFGRSAKTDAVGYNRYDGWYYSNFGGMSKWIKEKQQIDSRPTCISEYGGSGAVSQHMDNPTQRDIDPNGTRHWEEYFSLLHEETWADISSMNSIFGSFIWCMFDFSSAGRTEGDTVGQNDKGLATRERVPKDAFYFYKSAWSESPVVHITSKRFVKRPHEVPEVKVYSNAVSAELFVNGVPYAAP
jgi:beta-galactosidase